MITQKVFQAGNSQVVSIPKDLAAEVGLRIGDKIVMEKTPNGRGVVIMHVDEGVQKISKSKSDAEFQSWVDQFLEEDGEILDELANR